MKLEQHIPLAPLNTFRIGGNAAYFCRIRFGKDLEEAAEFVKKTKLPFFVLGEGSNSLVSDGGFSGLVMKMEICGVKIREIDASVVELVAGAGEHWDSVVELAVSKGLYGIENLSAIPGSVGAAPVQNIGAYGSEVKDVISFVEVFDVGRAIKGGAAGVGATGTIRTMTAEECQFGYRDSIFKRAEGRGLIITKVGFLLRKSGQVNIGYKDLRERFKERYSRDVTLAELRQAVIDIRAAKLPDIKKVGTAGSFFKNPYVLPEHFAKLKEQWPEIPGFREQVAVRGSSGKRAAANGKSKNFSKEKAEQKTEEKVKIPLAWILDHVCKLKGWKHPSGHVGTYESQPIALVNFGAGTALEVRATAQHVSDEVKRLTDIDIEWEVQMVGVGLA